MKAFELRFKEQFDRIWDRRRRDEITDEQATKAIQIAEGLLRLARERVTCWCGESGQRGEMFADIPPSYCGGTGIITCLCGGDFCVCHNHGDTECAGCDDCEREPFECGAAEVVDGL